ncbi:MAG: DUF1015 family protein [Candidatus Altiarchaeales archaeon]|nr:DUF1015 family protein [Candidatus Altiarchaeales archaeon]
MIYNLLFLFFWVVEVLPFKGIHYNGEKVQLEKVVTLPFDVLDEERRKKYLSKSEYNFVKLNLPQKGGSEDKYVKAAQTLNRWLDEGILVQDGESFYLYEEQYVIEGERRIQRGIVGKVKIEPFEEGIILPHEEIYEGPIADRYQLLSKTKADIEMIVGVYSDSEKKIKHLVDAYALGDPFIDFMHSDEIRHRMWHIKDDKMKKAITGALSDKKIIIADGHHRYTTALKYHVTENGLGEPYILMLVLNMDDDVLVLPTHRMINKLDKSLDDLMQDLGQYFDVSKKNSKQELVEVLRGKEDKHVFGLYAEGCWFTLELRDVSSLKRFMDLSDDRNRLDVSILHKLVIEHVMGVPENKEYLSFCKDLDEVEEKIDSGKHEIGLILNPTKLTQIKQIAEEGQRMPQKSTYFYPKPLSGLILRKNGD